MSKHVFRRCACRDENGKQYGASCPKLENPKHGSWGYYVAGGIDPITRKRIQYRKTGFSTQKAAREARNDVASKVDRGTYIAPTRETLATYLDAWLPRRAATGQGLRQTTVDNYRRYIDNDIKPSPLGAMALTDIRRFHINEFLGSLTAAGRGATTVRRVAAVLQGSLRAAARSNRIDHNPATELELPTVDSGEVHAWEPAEVGVFLDEAAKHRLGALFEVAMFTGLRRGELLGLRWTDVDLIKRTISVRNNRVQAKGQVVENPTKTASGRRTVDLDDRSVGAFVALQILQAQEQTDGQEAYTASGYVFTMEDGRPLKPQYATRLFDRIRVNAKLPKLTLHGSRHEHAALMIASGVDIAVVSKRLGHSSISITSDIYGHLIGSASRDAAQGAAALVPARSSGAHTVHTQGQISTPEHEKNRPTTGLIPSV
ncbi:integrase [Arthrobacter silviterrae]|uniref:Site-specific integrase n=1 Tax=Arthrobacter silviterrae TaxID=2026658 RepID=A0ABX0DCP2_9MICC|nr:tyrosine-type recombinase/integrase [Arthrobacter silviterrae]MDQ0275732.1 integrase [Arthrobacter silviterrae]NGN83170.1 site-specific integrase [Arthrobacter silviterrae]